MLWRAEGPHRKYVLHLVQCRIGGWRRKNRLNSVYMYIYATTRYSGTGDELTILCNSCWWTFGCYVPLQKRRAAPNRKHFEQRCWCSVACGMPLRAVRNAHDFIVLESKVTEKWKRRAFDTVKNAPYAAYLTTQRTSQTEYMVLPS